MKKITLVLGGIRSGKSHFAETKVLSYAPKPVYIATAQVFDEEMKERVELHRKRRGNQFEVIEEPQDICKVLDKLHDRTILVDCLTLNLSNRLLKDGDGARLEDLWRQDQVYLEEIRRIAMENRLNITFVSNEVGLSPVVPNKLGRIFQELQGNWNRMVAGFADEVYTLNAGIVNRIKKNSQAPFKIGAPSYLLPTGYIENVTYLQDKVEDIQLLLFDTLEDDGLFKEETITTLAYMAEGGGPSYSAHMQVNPDIFHEEGFNRRLELARHTMTKLAPLDIGSFTFHYDLPKGKKWQELDTQEIGEIDVHYIRFFKTLKKDFPHVDISLENTATPLSALDRVVGEVELSYCIDIGHLLVQDWPLDEILSRIPRASVIHLHGSREEKGEIRDHRAVTYNAEVFKNLEKFKGILTIEVYHPMFLKESIAALTQYF